VDIDEARRFITENHRATLATYRADGRPQLSTVMAVLDENGAVIISSREHAYKVRNLRRDPRASMLVMTDDFFTGWIQVDGTATIVSLPEAMEVLVGYYRTASGEHPDWDEYRQAMKDQERVIIRIAIERAGPDRAA
jgi:PPOX class probable F420-dependent enzyme